jgi:tetratricopeptide (TPR) repeat protein
MLEAAESEAGKSPSAVRTWVLLRQAEEYAVVGEEALCHRKLDFADAAFAPLQTMPRGMYHHWTPDMLAAFRGNCERLLGRHSASLDILSGAWKRLDPATVSNRIALQADLAAVYAEQGVVDQAANLLNSALESAAHAGLQERVKRVIGIRRTLLTHAKHPLIAQFDEQARDLRALESPKDT